MQTIYTLFLVASILSLVLYKKPLLAQKVGFGLASILSLYAAVFFLSNLNDTLLWKLPGNFISAPLFRLEPLGIFFSFLISLIAFAVSLFSFEYAKHYEKKSQSCRFLLPSSMHSSSQCFLLLRVIMSSLLCFYGK